MIIYYYFIIIYYLPLNVYAKHLHKYLFKGHALYGFIRNYVHLVEQK